eukprot:239280_1
MLPFMQIDKALSIYYGKYGLLEYYNNYEHGLFMKYIIDEELNDLSLPIEDELGPGCDAHNCSYTDFDSDFPIPTFKNIKLNKIDRETVIFHVIQFCYKHKHPPSMQYIKKNLNEICNRKHTEQWEAEYLYHQQLQYADDKNEISQLKQQIINLQKENKRRQNEAQFYKKKYLKQKN